MMDVSWGYFFGDVVTKWLHLPDVKRNWWQRVIDWLAGSPRDRAMELVESFDYIDRHGTRWHARAGSIIDGSSIPRPFWRVLGAPLDSDHRRPSVIHDVYYKLKSVPRKSVDIMFYEGMRCEGVPAWQAGVIYRFVRWFGWSGWNNK